MSEISDVITNAAGLITALVVIFSAIFAVYRWYLKQNHQDEDIKGLRAAHNKDVKAIKEEQCVMCKALLACLSGLKQLGANGDVTKVYSELEEHINKQAHE